MAVKQKEFLLLPVGRLVQGSLYDGNDKDLDGRLLVWKTGIGTGKPKVEYYIAIAIEKRGEKHWAETEWGSKIWAKGHTGFPEGQASQPGFSWKIIDGDDTRPNQDDNIPCEQEGFAGHWVLKCKTSFAINIYDKTSKPLLTPDAINRGDYIEAYIEVRENASDRNPGVFLRPVHVAFRAEGKKISAGLNVKSIGFGEAPLPNSFVPPSTVATPAPAASTPPPVTNNYPVSPAPSAAPTPVPHTGILTPPTPVAPPIPVAPPAKVMTAKANGIPYDQWIAIGWSDAQLIADGYLIA